MFPPDLPDTAVATPPLWPVPVAPTSDNVAFIHAAFPKLASIMPQRAVLLVPDGGLYLTFRTLRMFRDAGVAVDLVCPIGHPLTRSRYVRHVCQVPYWEAAEDLVTRILRIPQRPWQRIIISHEPSVRRLVASLDLPTLIKWQPGAAQPGVREFFQGKFGLLGAQARWGLPIPPSRLCHNLAELREFAVQIGGPLVVKPSEQMGGVGIKKFADFASVEAQGSALQFPLLAQKFIVGRRIVLEVLSTQGHLLGWLASYSIAQANGPFTYSTGRQFRAMPALKPLAEIIARTGFEGFSGIDCMEEADTGQIYVMEFNPRHSSGWRFAPNCQVDMTAAIAAWVDNTTNFPPFSQPPGWDVLAHYFPTDLIRCLRKRDWTGLKNWLPGAKSRHDICWDDPMPFLAFNLGRFFKKIHAKAAQPPGTTKQ